jgi:hypothetical protein
MLTLAEIAEVATELGLQIEWVDDKSTLHVLNLDPVFMRWTFFHAHEKWTIDTVLAELSEHCEIDLSNPNWRKASDQAQHPQ